MTETPAENYGYRPVHTFLHQDNTGSHDRYTVWFQEGNESFMITKHCFDAIGNLFHTQIGKETYGCEQNEPMNPGMALAEALIELLVCKKALNEAKHV